MTRHITDQPQATQTNKRAAVFLKLYRRRLVQAARRRTFEQARTSGNGRLVQYLRIERGRTV
jgi:hypothetical protein